MIETFEKYLRNDFSDDYWSDEGIDQALLLLAKFSESDWNDLRICTEQSTDKVWLTRCCEVLGDDSSNESIAILLRLMASESSEVSVAALDSLNAVMSGGVDLSSQRENISARLEKAAAGASNVSLIMIDSLRKKLALLPR